MKTAPGNSPGAILRFIVSVNDIAAVSVECPFLNPH
jgi:hypothetical protein